ncbi:MAG: FecR family protein [Alphaproteobacteria bacterium]|jgi:hypothetical protein
MYRFVFAAVLALPLTVPSALALDIGSVQSVLVYAYGTPATENRRALFPRTKVVTNEVVETVSDGGLHLTFLDGTDFRLGAESRVTLDEFVYDPDVSSGKMALNLSKGVFRFVSGKLDKRGVRLVTPTVSIGIRGTDFFVVVADDGSTSVKVEEGEVEVTQLSGGASAIVVAGSAAIFAAGGAVSLDANVVVNDPGVTGDGGGDTNPSGGDSGDGGGGQH